MAKSRNKVPELSARKKKPKPSRSEKVETAPEVVPAPAPEVPAKTPAPVQAPEEAAPVIHTEPALPEPTHASNELKTAKPRKSGRVALDINLGGEGHTWERVVTPDHQIVFRFKDEPSDAQHALIDKFGFGYNHEAKEAHRPNDATGRTYADKLAWYLREAQRAPVGHSLAG